MPRRLIVTNNGPLQVITTIAASGPPTSVENTRLLIQAMTLYFRNHLASAGYSERSITAITTKFRDAGRRSAPWKPASERVPGRPQNGADGNRQNRWLFEESHKYYADEVTATLVEVKYYLQALSMEDAPPLPLGAFQKSFGWLVDHPVVPGTYFDPIQLVPINLRSFLHEPRSVQSGHFIPLDRGGRHVPSNTFLMLARSNQLQGNLTFDELLTLMEQIVTRHRERTARPTS